MYALVQRTPQPFSCLALHGALSIASVMAVRTAARLYDAPYACFISWVTSLMLVIARHIMLWIQRWCSRTERNIQHSTSHIDRVHSSESTTAVSQLYFFGDAAIWMAVEILMTTSIIFNSISVHFMGILLLQCLCTMFNVASAGASASAGVPINVAVANERSRWHVRLVYAGHMCAFSILTVFACVSMYADDYDPRGIVSIFLYIVLNFYRSQAASAWRRATIARDKSDSTPRVEEMLAVTARRATMAALVLPIMCPFVDDYTFVNRGEWPLRGAVPLLLFGCVCRCSARLLLDKAMSEFLARPSVCVLRKANIWLLASEQFVSLMVGYYFMCERMALWIELPALLSVAILVMCALALESSIFNSHTGDSDGDSSPILACSAAPICSPTIISTVFSLHDGFY